MKEIGVRGPTVSLGDDMLPRINVTTDKGGSVGLIKNNGDLAFPAAFLSPSYETYRKHIKDVMPDLVKDAKAGKVDPALLVGVGDDVEKMRAQLARDVFDLSPRQYIEALRYLRQLDDVVKVLRDPDAKNFFNNKFAAQGKDVGVLVKYMAESGLRFAPAVAGDEAAYSALHHALATYDLALQNAVAKE